MVASRRGHQLVTGLSQSVRIHTSDVLASSRAEWNNPAHR
jgi:hypothetical protein